MNQSHASRTLCFTALLSLGTLCQGQQSLVNTYAQNFDSMGLGTTPPPGWTVLEGNSGTNNETWQSAITANGANSVASMIPTTGPLTASAAPTTTNDNGYNAQGNYVTDRVLATSPTLVSGSALDLLLTNGSGQAYTTVFVAYDTRRFTVATEGGVPSPNNLPGYQLFFSLNGGPWTNVAALNPTLEGPGGVVVPNTVGVTSVPPTAVNLGASWQIGQTLELRWVDDNSYVTSPDQILGLDNVIVSFTAPAPIVSSVLNNYSMVPAGLPSSGIAQGALFAVAGTALANPDQAAELQDATLGLPTTLNGTSVQVTSGGTTVTPALYYASATQLALVLPSNTPVGTAQITVSYNGQTSAPYSFQVVQSAPGFATYYGTGSGLGVALNAATYLPYSYVNSIPPGTTVILYGTGLGADAATDTKYAAGPFNINSLAHIYVGGVDSPILYQGSFSYPGLNQVSVTIPASSPTGCSVPLVGVTAAGIPTNFVTLPIGTGPCSDPALGFTGTQLLTLSNQATVNTAQVYLLSGSESGQSISEANAQFQSYTGGDFLANVSPGVSMNGCVVSQGESTETPAVALDAGAISVSAPGGAAPIPLTLSPGIAGSSVADLTIPATGGAFTFQAAGGANIASFTGSLTLPNPMFSWTNQSAAATVTRSAGWPVTWTGGGSNFFVEIYGGSQSSTTGAIAEFTCVVPGSAGQFTVPAYVLAALPAGSGFVQVSSQNNFTGIAAKGIDWGSLSWQTFVYVDSTIK